jgi:hypothetical protein
MGRRVLRISARFLPVLMGEGVHHYFVGKDALPEDSRVVDASVNFRATHGADELVLLIESDYWEEAVGVPAPVIEPLFIRRHSACDVSLTLEHSGHLSGA